MRMNEPSYGYIRSLIPLWRMSITWALSVLSVKAGDSGESGGAAGRALRVFGSKCHNARNCTGQDGKEIKSYVDQSYLRILEPGLRLIGGLMSNY